MTPRETFQRSMSNAVDKQKAKDLLTNRYYQFQKKKEAEENELKIVEKEILDELKACPKVIVEEITSFLVLCRMDVFHHKHLAIQCGHCEKPVCRISECLVCEKFLCGECDSDKWVSIAPQKICGFSGDFGANKYMCSHCQESVMSKFWSVCLDCRRALCREKCNLCGDRNEERCLDCVAAYEFEMGRMRRSGYGNYYYDWRRAKGVWTLQIKGI